ncbi:MAG: hypothetical protein AAFY17_04185 [Cyanobacteria bacterium J06642_11]
MLKELFAGAALGCLSLFVIAPSSHGSSGASNESVTVDVYGSSYSVELDHEATDQVLRNQPWWGNRGLASELCETLVRKGEEIASVGYNTTQIGDKDYIEAYLVMPLATCTGPVLIEQEDIGQMTGATFFVISGSVCLTNHSETLHAHLPKDYERNLIYQKASAVNCGYFDSSILYEKGL